MKIQYGSKIGRNYILHSGIHNETRNPHPQYCMPIYYTSTPSTADIGKLTKVFSTESFSKTDDLPMIYLDLKILTVDLNSINTIKGNLKIDIQASGNDCIASSSFYSENKELINFYDLFYIYKVDEGTNYHLEGYLKVLRAIQLKIIPVIIDINRYKYPYDIFVTYPKVVKEPSYLGERSNLITFYDEQPFVPLSTIANTLLSTSTVENSVLYFDTLPTPSSKFKDKFLLVQGKHMYTYNSISNTFIKINYSQQEYVYTGGSGTLDVSDNRTSIQIVVKSSISISAISNGFNGQIIQILNNSGTNKITLVASNSLKLKASVNAAIASNQYITLRNFSGNWFEISRSF